MGWRIRTWGITARLVMVAAVPSFVMFVVVTLWLYLEGSAAIRAELDARSRIVAAALAEASQYGLVSGNVGYLDKAVVALLDDDHSIATIDIFDAQRKPIVAIGNVFSEPALPPFEREVRADMPDVDLFDQPGPHVSQSAASQPAFRAGPVVGYVRVAMSPAPMLAAKRERLVFSALIVAVATAISLVAGLWLAQRLSAPLHAAMAALRAIRQGIYDVRLELASSGELRELQQAILEAAKGLGITRQELESQVQARTRELQQAVEQVRLADSEKRRLIARGNTLIEEERQRIAMEIHDHLNAALIVVRLEAQHIAGLASQQADEPALPEIERTARRISATTDTLYAAARQIVKQLRPEILDTLGLKGALEEMLRQYDELHPACRFAFEPESQFPDLRGQLAITAYRLVQEALSNIVKHADATRARVRLERGPTPSRVRIVVADNGKGYDGLPTSQAGTGVIGMRERVLACGGTMAIARSPGGGTTITFELPAGLPEG